MRLLINLSNIRHGGGLQVAVSFVNELRFIDDENKYVVVYNTSFTGKFDLLSFDSRFVFIQVSGSPASFKKHYKVVRELNILVQEHRVDLVFSLFGPTVWCPKVKHLSGFGNSLFLYPNGVHNRLVPWCRRLIKAVIYKIKLLSLKKSTNYYVVETDHVKSALIQRLGIPEENISVVYNTYSAVFDTAPIPYDLPLKKKDEFRCFVLTSDYSHKNNRILGHVMKVLRSQGYENIFFYLSLTKEQLTANKLCDPNIIPLGLIEHSQLPAVYSQMDISLFPSLIESFTAVYPESMKMEVPILTSDLFFAHEICRDAAEYFDPFDPQDIARKIILIMENKERRNALLHAGRGCLHKFSSARVRCQKYLYICESLLKK